MDPNGAIYRAPSDQIPAEDAARLEGYLHAKVEAQELAEKVRGLERANVVEAAVWGELNKRRWFGRHVEEDEMESLVVDLRTAIAGAVVASSEDVSP